jgi:hypothetical protein
MHEDGAVMEDTVRLVRRATDVGCVYIVGHRELYVGRVDAELMTDIDRALELINGTVAVGKTVGAVVTDRRCAPDRWRGRRWNMIKGPVAN